MDRTKLDQGTPTKLPFWRRTAYVSVRGQASAIERTGFNWPMLKPLALVLAILLAGGLVWMTALITVAAFRDGVAILKFCAPVLWFVCVVVVYGIAARKKIWQ